MIKSKKTQGFTLIELLVVIAIIGILSSVVLASLSTARNKGSDAKVQGQLASMRAAAEIVYGNNSNSYGTSANCTAAAPFNDTVSGMAGLVTGTTGILCGSNGTAWSASAPLVSVTARWCVDSTGASKYSNSHVANTFVC